MKKLLWVVNKILEIIFETIGAAFEEEYATIIIEAPRTPTHINTKTHNSKVLNYASFEFLNCKSPRMHLWLLCTYYKTSGGTAALGCYSGKR